MSYCGDFALGSTFDIKFTTVGTTGAPTQLAGSPAVAAYPNNSTTELTAGITLSVDFDSRTGLNNVRVVATSGNGYAAGSNYDLVITAGTVGGTSVVGYVIGSFSIEARSAIRPTTAGRTLTVESDGMAHADIKEWLGSAPNALQSGRVDSYVGAVLDGVLTAAKFASGAFDAVWSVATRILTAATNITSTGGTTVPQTGDSFARLGAPAGASVSADVAAVKTTADAIEVDTQDIQSRLPAALVSGRMSSDAVAISGSTAAADAVEANIGNLDDAITDAVAAPAAALTAYDPPTHTELVNEINDVQSDIAGLNDLSAAQVNAEVDTALADYDGPTYTEVLNLFRLALRKDSAIATDLSSLLTAINADLASGGGAFANTADALEAIRDRGDAAWTTGSAPSAAAIRSEIDANSTQLAAIVADTNELQTDWADGGRLDLILDARASQTTANNIETDTQDIQSRLPAALVSGRMSSDAVAISGSTAAADAVEANIGNLDDAVSDAVAAPAAALTSYDPPTRTEATSDKAEILTRLGTPAGASVSADVAAVQTTADAIEADTQNLQGRTPAALVGGRVDASVGAVNGDATAAANLEGSAETIVRGTVDTAAFSPTTTAFEADDITEATADHYIGRIVIFRTGALAGQATDITDYALSSGRGRFTVTAMTETPANDDTFVIV